MLNAHLLHSCCGKRILTLSFGKAKQVKGQTHGLVWINFRTHWHIVAIPLEMIGVRQQFHSWHSWSGSCGTSIPSVRSSDLTKESHRFGSFHSHGASPMAGWFLFGKIPFKWITPFMEPPLALLTQARRPHSELHVSEKPKVESGPASAQNVRIFRLHTLGCMLGNLPLQ